MGLSAHSIYVHSTKLGNTGLPKCDLVHVSVSCHREQTAHCYQVLSLSTHFICDIQPRLPDTFRNEHVHL